MRNEKQYNADELQARTSDLESDQRLSERLQRVLCVLWGRIGRLARVRATCTACDTRRRARTGCRQAGARDLCGLGSDRVQAVAQAVGVLALRTIFEQVLV